MPSNLPYILSIVHVFEIWPLNKSSSVIHINYGFHIKDNICRVMWQDIIGKIEPLKRQWSSQHDC